MQKAGLLTINAWAIDGFTKVFWRDLPCAGSVAAGAGAGGGRCVLFALRGGPPTAGRSCKAAGHSFRTLSPYQELRRLQSSSSNREAARCSLRSRWNFTRRPWLSKMRLDV